MSDLYTSLRVINVSREMQIKEISMFIFILSLTLIWDLQFLFQSDYKCFQDELPESNDAILSFYLLCFLPWKKLFSLLDEQWYFGYKLKFINKEPQTFGYKLENLKSQKYLSTNPKLLSQTSHYVVHKPENKYVIIDFEA